MKIIMSPLLLISLLLISLLLISLPTNSICISTPNPNSSPPSLPPHPTLIQKICSTTTYYDFCMSSLSGDPKSQDSDVRGLSTIIINLAISNSTNTSSYALSLSSNSTNTSMKTLLRSCSAKYSNASQALRLSMDAIQNSSFDDAFVHVSAAGEYPNVCRVLFRQQPKLVYPPEMMKREALLERLCVVALDIISLLIQY